MEFEKLPPAERLKFDKHFNQQVQVCLDRGLGECWLKHEACIAALRAQMFRANGERHHLGDFVIMPNWLGAIDIGPDWVSPYCSAILALPNRLLAIVLSVLEF